MWWDTDYVYAIAPGIVAVLGRTDLGWRCRSTARDALQHDYVSRESLSHVRSFLDLTHRGILVTGDREAALEAIDSAMGGGGGFLHPSPHDHADPANRVLRHLESGW